MRVLLATVVLGTFAISACGGDAKTAALPWTTAVDSTGDTARVRISGDVPEELVRTLTVDLQIGEADGAEELTFGRIGGIFVGANGTLYVYDAHQTVGLIRLYSQTGEYIRTLGAKGGGPGEYGQLNGFTLAPNGDVVLWDGSGGRVNRYSAAGDYLSSFRVPISGFFTSNGVQVSNDGTISLRSTVGMRQGPSGMVGTPGAIRLDSAGTVIDSVAYPSWSTAEPAVLFVESPDGRMRAIFSVPFQPSPVTAVLPEGGFAGGYSDRYAFTIARTGGKPRQVIREVAAVPVSETEQSQHRALIEQNAKRTNPSFSWTGPGIPAIKPAFTSILIGDDGRLWVRVAQAAEPIPEDQMPPVRTDVVPTPVRLTMRDPVAYDVYTAEGELLGRVKLPPRTTVYRVRGNHAWGVSRDDDDVEFATRFRILPDFDGAP